MNTPRFDITLIGDNSMRKLKDIKLNEVYNHALSQAEIESGVNQDDLELMEASFGCDSESKRYYFFDSVKGCTPVIVKLTPAD